MLRKFKTEYNKVDSSQNRNFKLPEIFELINEAQLIFIKKIAQPRVPNNLGFELNQRTINDIRPLVVEGNDLSGIDVQKYNTNSYIATLPSDYMFYVVSEVEAEKIITTQENKKNKTYKCVKRLRGFVRQHEDEFEFNPFTKSSFEWRKSNVTVFGNKLQYYVDETFTLTKAFITYIRYPKYIHLAEQWSPTGYTLPGESTPLTGKQDCELAKHTWDEIVDIAVKIATIQVSPELVQIKNEKINTVQ